MSTFTGKSKRIKKYDIQKFEVLADMLNDLMHDITSYCPDANLYAEGAGNLYLLKGPSHSCGISPKELRENIVRRSQVWTLDGGGW